MIKISNIMLKTFIIFGVVSIFGLQANSNVKDQKMQCLEKASSAQEACLEKAGKKKYFKDSAASLCNRSYLRSQESCIIDSLKLKTKLGIEKHIASNVEKKVQRIADLENKAKEPGLEGCNAKAELDWDKCMKKASDYLKTQDERKVPVFDRNKGFRQCESRRQEQIGTCEE